MEHLKQPQMSDSLLRQLKRLLQQLNYVRDAANNYPAANNRSGEALIPTSHGLISQVEMTTENKGGSILACQAAITISPVASTPGLRGSIALNSSRPPEDKS